LQSLQSPVQTEMASAYAFAAIPARIALGRQNWAEAAALEPRSPQSFPWASYPAVEAITHFARALGAARSGRGESARQSLGILAELRDRAAAANAYWGTQVEIQRLSAAAWLHLAEGQRTEALATMRRAADLESSTEKHPVTPGEVLPARELLADMLLERREYAAARKEYAATLERSPNLFNSVYGIARSAELARDEAVAIESYRKLLDLSGTSKSETRPARLRDADRYLKSHR
jgi:tetratricopeptide (TPR) repeat protein